MHFQLKYQLNDERQLPTVDHRRKKADCKWLLKKINSIEKPKERFFKAHFYVVMKWFKISFMLEEEHKKFRFLHWFEVRRQFNG